MMGHIKYTTNNYYTLHAVEKPNCITHKNRIEAPVQCNIYYKYVYQRKSIDSFVGRRAHV